MLRCYILILSLLYISYGAVAKTTVSVLFMSFILFFKIAYKNRKCHPCARHIFQCCGVISPFLLFLYLPYGSFAKTIVFALSCHSFQTYKNAFLMSSMRQIQLSMLWCCIIVFLLLYNSYGYHRTSGSVCVVYFIHFKLTKTLF